jgi:hypothetical protein
MLAPLTILGCLSTVRRYFVLYYPYLLPRYNFLGVLIAGGFFLAPIEGKEMAFPDISYVPTVKISDVDSFLSHSGTKFRVLYSEQQQNVLSKNVSQFILGGEKNEFYKLLVNHPVNVIKVDLPDLYSCHFSYNEFSSFANSLCVSAYTHSGNFAENIELTTNFDLLGRKRPQFGTPFYLQDRNFLPSFYKTP